jgi:Flp pilus assembly protein CpaB
VQFAQRLLSTRGGTIALSVTAAVLAGVILVTYLHRYRNSVKESGVAVTVLTAKSLINKGTSGDIIAAQNLYDVSSQPKSEVADGAITDPAALKGRIAAADIFPGEQLTTAKMAVSTSTSLSNHITGDQRAVNIPVDAAHGMVAQLQTGDHIDLFAGFNVQAVGKNGIVDPSSPTKPVTKLLVPDVLVLGIPSSSSSGVSGGTSKTMLTLEMTDQEAADAAFTADNGIIWAMLRPRANAAAPSPDIVSIETVLFGVPAVRVYKQLGGKGGQ